MTTTVNATAEPNRPTTPRVPRCRYLIRTGRGTSGVELARCTGEVAAPGAEIELCPRHLANALALLHRVGAQAQTFGRRDLDAPGVLFVQVDGKRYHPHDVDIARVAPPED